jgi:hypothetical protein
MPTTRALGLLSDCTPSGAPPYGTTVSGATVVDAARLDAARAVADGAAAAVAQLTDITVSASNDATPSSAPGHGRVRVGSGLMLRS